MLLADEPTGALDRHRRDRAGAARGPQPPRPDDPLRDPRRAARAEPRPPDRPARRRGDRRRPRRRGRPRDGRHRAKALADLRPGASRPSSSRSCCSWPAVRRRWRWGSWSRRTSRSSGRSARRPARISSSTYDGSVPDAELAATSNAAGVTAAAGPWPVTVGGLGHPRGGVLMQQAFSGRPRPDASIDNVTLVAGRWWQRSGRDRPRPGHGRDARQARRRHRRRLRAVRAGRRQARLPVPDDQRRRRAHRGRGSAAAASGCLGRGRRHRRVGQHAGCRRLAEPDRHRPGRGGDRPGQGDALPRRAVRHGGGPGSATADHRGPPGGRHGRPRDVPRRPGRRQRHRRSLRPGPPRVLGVRPARGRVHDRERRQRDRPRRATATSG